MKSVHADSRMICRQYGLFWSLGLVPCCLFTSAHQSIVLHWKSFAEVIWLYIKNRFLRPCSNEMFGEVEWFVKWTGWFSFKTPCSYNLIVVDIVSLIMRVYCTVAVNCTLNAMKGPTVYCYLNNFYLSILSMEKVHVCRRTECHFLQYFQAHKKPFSVFSSLVLENLADQSWSPLLMNSFCYLSGQELQTKGNLKVIKDNKLSTNSAFSFTFFKNIFL